MLFRRRLFRYEITDEGLEAFYKERSEISNLLQDLVALQKQLAENRDYDGAKLLKKLFIQDLKSDLKALEIVRFVLIDGNGRIEDYPVELESRLLFFSDLFNQ